MARALLVLACLLGCGRLGFDELAPDDGGNGDGDGDAPLPVGRWKSVTVSFTTGCGITVDGELWCWGQGFAGQLGTGATPGTSPPTRVGAASDWTQVSTEGELTCGLRGGGDLWCWGNNYEGALGTGVINQRFPTPQQVSAGVVWKVVETGDFRACAIRSDDTLWCWGSNTKGGLGIGSLVNEPRPVQVGTSTWSSVTVGFSTTCGIRTDGSAWCWGDNYLGQVGDGTTTRRTAPVPVMPGTTWQAIDVGYEHTCAVSSTLAVWCWGRNSEGQVGDGSVADRNLPVVVAAPPITQVTTGAFHSCGRTTAGDLWCWGDASRGRIAGFDQVSLRAPAQLVAPPATAVTAGGSTTCAIDAASHLFCTGSNNSGQAGLAHGEVHTTERSDDRLDWLRIFAHAGHACGLLTDGRALCWGRGSTGQLGDGERLDRKTPVSAGSTVFDNIELGDNTTVGRMGTASYSWGYDRESNTVTTTPTMRGNGLGVALGYDHGCSISPTGTLSCVGANLLGQLGNGTTTPSTVPVAITGTWERVAAWTAVTCGVPAGLAGLQCWGDGPGTGTDNAGSVLTPAPVVGITGLVTRVELGARGGCALVGAGELWCWGTNEYGQVGDGTRIERRATVRVGQRADWRVVDTGETHVCAIPADGTLWCWGHDDQGQLGRVPSTDAYVPTQVGVESSWVDVACGAHFTCAIKADGTRWCFGVNDVGQLGNQRGWLSEFTVVP